MSEIARTMARQVGGMGGMGMPNVPGVRQTANLDDAATELKRFISYMRRGNQTLTATEKYQLGAAKRELKATTDRIAAAEAERKAREEHKDEIEEGSEAQAKNTKRVEDATKQLAGFAEKVIGGTLSFTVLTRAVNEFSQAYKQGFNWNAMSDTVNAALKMGMSPKDMMDFQKRFRRVSNTLEGGITEFNNTVGASNVEWLHYTGSLKDASIAQGEFYDLALSMGVGANNMKGAVGGMFAEFKKLQVATSMTAEEFVATQKSLLGEKAVRDKLIGLQGKERINYMNKLTDTAYMFQTLGLQKEAAEGMVKLIESQSSKGGVTRLREGAQLQAVAGILGMGGQDATNLQRLRSKRNLSKDEQVQLADLYSKMSERIQAKKDAGGFQEYQMDALEEKFPILQELVNQVGGSMALAKGAEAKQSTIAAQSLDLQERDSGVYGVIKENIVRFVNIFDGWSQSMLAAVLGLVAGKLALNHLPGALRGFGGGPAGGPGGGAGGGPGAGGAGWRGKVGDFAGKYGPGLMKGGLLAAVVATAGSMAIDSYVTDKTAKGGAMGALNGAALGATIGSVIPGLGTLAGGAIGGIAGGLIGIVANQKTMDDNLDEQKKKIIEQQSLDERRFQLARDQYQKEIDQLNTKGDLTKAEDARLEELKKRMADNDADHEASQNKASVNEIGYTLSKQALAKDWMAQAAGDIKKGGMFFDADSGDVNDKLSQYRGKLSAAGLNMSDSQVQAQFYTILRDLVGKSDAATANRGFDAIAQLQQGGDYDTKLLNPLIAQAMQGMATNFSTDFTNANQATFAAKVNTPQAIAAMQDQVKSTVDQMEKDRAELEALKSTSAFDESGYSSAEAAKVQKRLEMNQQTLDALQQLASKDNTVKFQSEDALLEVLTKLADSMDRNPPKRVKP